MKLLSLLFISHTAVYQAAVFSVGDFERLLYATEDGVGFET